MAFPTAVNDQVTDSVTQVRKFEFTPLQLAKLYLGTKWVLHSQSTYDAKMMQRDRMCLTLRPAVHKAILEGRL